MSGGKIQPSLEMWKLFSSLLAVANKTHGNYSAFRSSNTSRNGNLKLDFRDFQNDQHKTNLEHETGTKNQSLTKIAIVCTQIPINS